MLDIYLEPYKTRGDYSDITIIVDGKKYDCHKIILARASRYFDAIFSSSFKERDAKEIKIGHLTRDAFDIFIELAYKNKINLYGLPMKMWTELYELAIFLVVEVLERNISHHMEQILMNANFTCSVVPSYITTWLTFCCRHRLHNLLNLIWLVIEAYFTRMKKRDILVFTYEDMMRIVEHNGLMYGEEKDILEYVLFWIEDKRDELDEYHIERLLSHIRYGAINDISAIKKMLADSHIDEDLITEMTKKLERYKEGDHLAMEVEHRPYFTKRGYDQIYRLSVSHTGVHIGSDFITKLPSELEKVSDDAIAIMGAHIFFIGGRTLTETSDSVYTYSILNKEWKFYSSLATARYRAVAISSGDRIFVLGGRTPGYAINSIEEFGPHITRVYPNGPRCYMSDAAFSILNGQLGIIPMYEKMGVEGTRKIFLIGNGRWKEISLKAKHLKTEWMTMNNRCFECKRFSWGLWVKFTETGYTIQCPRCHETRRNYH